MVYWFEQRGVRTGTCSGNSFEYAKRKSGYWNQVRQKRKISSAMSRPTFWQQGGTRKTERNGRKRREGAILKTFTKRGEELKRLNLLRRR